MASSVIHICIANEINKKIKRDSRLLLIGTIAPDISKLIGESKVKSHFLGDWGYNVPNLDKFLAKYRGNLNDDFVLGYYIHLYVDYLWFKYFIPKIIEGNYIRELDGTLVKYNEETFTKFVYNDYTNTNIQLINKYDFPMKIFYEKVPKIDSIIEEIPMDKLDIIVNKTGVLIENAKNGTKYLFKIDDVITFIENATEIILKDIKTLYDED